MKPCPLLTGSERDVRFCPPAGPVVFFAIEAGGPEPVLPCQIVRVADAHSSLLRRPYEKKSAERPECLTAETLARLLVEQDHPLAGIGKLTRGNEAGESRSHNDHICVQGEPPLI